VSTLADLRPGMIGFGPIHGGAGALVNAGQLLLGEGFHVGKLDIRHVFVVTDVYREPSKTATQIADAFNVPVELVGSWGPRAVEAMPSGARQISINDRWMPEYAYVQLPEDYPGQGEDAAAVARAMIGTPYSFASYAALAAWRFGMKAPRLEAWIDRRKPLIEVPNVGPDSADDIAQIALPREAICSVLADQAWALTGKQVMPKGTPHQCVTPGALAGHLLGADGVKWIWPGR
jgi:hypothetical protein